MARPVSTRKVLVVLPVDLVEAIDKDRGSQDRSSWLADAASMRLGRVGVPRDELESIASAAAAAIRDYRRTTPE